MPLSASLLAAVALACAAAAAAAAAAAEQPQQPQPQKVKVKVNLPLPDEHNLTAVAAFARAWGADARHPGRWGGWAAAGPSHPRWAQGLAAVRANVVRLRGARRTHPRGVFNANKFLDWSAAEFAASWRVPRPAAGADLVRSCLAHGVTHVGRHAAMKKEGSSSSESSASSSSEAGVGAAPAAFDWRSKGVVTPVKNQGQCGSCWTFSTTGAIESATAIKSGKAPVSLSEQEIVDCSHACTDEPPYGSVCNQGCNGGWPWAAMSSVVQWKGLATEAQYPYTAMTGECHRNASTMLHSPITNWTCLSGAGAPDGGPASEVDMVEFLYKNGPLSIALDANPLQFYDGGIVDPYSWDPLFGCSRSSLDHALLITGYGTYKSDFDGEIPSWTVKNSWGADWGNDGYFFIRRGNNECGIAEAVTHPVVA